MNKELKTYYKYLSEEKYFEAHEALEPLWLQTKKENAVSSLPLKALINAAIAFEHIKRDTPNAKEKAFRVFKGYTKYKETFPSKYNGIRKLINTIAIKLGLS